MSTEANETVLEALRAEIESDGFSEGFGMVYLDNARPAGMSARAFAGHLSQLTQRGLYKDAGDGVFGEVRRA